MPKEGLFFIFFFNRKNWKRVKCLRQDKINIKIIIKTNMTIEMLKKLNDGYNEFHSQFIVENVINPKEILKLKEEV